MKKSQLELALNAAGRIARDSEFIVFGSQSILGTVTRPPKACLVSQEVDLYPRNHPQAMTLIVDGLGRRSAFFRKNGFFVDCVTPDLAAFPEGWTDRLKAFRTKHTGGVTGWCVELHDIAASKLAAGREKDLNYVSALLTAKLIKPLILKNRVATLPVNSAHRTAIVALIEQLNREARMKRRSQRKKS
jgi:hypothetical protein